MKISMNPQAAPSILGEVKKVEGRLASLNKTVKTMKAQQSLDQERTLALERENMIG